ncbi:hypothetical protein RclHR1_14990003 [Rhizophagus clarus]|uniref:Reverse transcriptase domain-containing protein n=1 Tax=Rhizophagus clarus TaxID=94130 RepID=A0A2Z6QIA1_9GLOM|nr:hypothetical protein RclHR1_14990003 [Rhizophagus clarus]
MPSQFNLKTILDLADQFYSLNDIQVNKDKSVLLVCQKRSTVPRCLRNFDPLPVQLKFGNSTINITPLEKSESVRILGVLFNYNNSYKNTIKKISAKITDIALRFARKQITEKQLAYIFNAVIIPHIEFWSQTKILLKNILYKFMAKILRVFKHKLHLAFSAPNITLFRHIFRINTLLDNHTQAKITNFLIQINSSDLLEKLSLLQLAQIQYNNWLPYHLLYFLPYFITLTHRSNFLIQSIVLCNNNNITFYFNTNFLPYVQEGNIPMIGILKDTYHKHNHNLKQLNILFLDQILNRRAQIYT